MSLQAAIEAQLPFLRAEAEARMTSTATIYRKTGLMVQDESTGLEVPEWVAIHTGIPFRLGGSDQGDSASRRQDIGGVEVQTAVRVGHLPVVIDDLTDGDFIDITSGENAGRAFRIVEVEFKDQATARRVPLLAENRPEEWP
jgi:hypothetical protein